MFKWLNLLFGNLKTTHVLALPTIFLFSKQPRAWGAWMPKL
jgi:hypothetical protein